MTKNFKSSIWKTNLENSKKVLESILASDTFLESCGLFSDHLVRLFQKGGTLYVCGNGGSHCDAMHFAEELTGRFRGNRRALPALALGDAAHMSCVGNDYGFEHVFERQIQAFGRKEDLLVVLSTSGNSKNVLLAVQAAKVLKMDTVGLLGRDGGRLRTEVDLALVVPAETSDRIQEVHIKLIHTVIESCERVLFPENYT